MRFSRLALATAVASISVLGVTGPAFAQPSAPAAGNGHSGEHATMAGSAPTPSVKAPTLDEGIQRSRLKPLFLAAKLSGKQEVKTPEKPNVGDPDGSATGLVRVQGNRVTFAFAWKGITAPQLGHVHRGVAGRNGPVAVTLFGTPLPDTASAAAGVVTVDDPATADALRADPAGFYLNLHTTEFPDGAVRGQLAKLTSGQDLLSLLDAGTAKAFLSGDQEVPVKGGKPVGDPSGHAVAHITARDGSVRYSLAWLGLRPTLGHIHNAVRGANGPVKVPLFGTPIPASVTAIAGTVTGVDGALIQDIARNPEQFYVNLHTAEFPDGAVRGQLWNPARQAQPTKPAAQPSLTATSAILDSGKNFSEPDGSTGVSGRGCQNVPGTIAVRSIDAGGTYQIWSGPNCTGRSAVVTDRIADLDPIGFDRQVAAIRFK
jgi:hypothetical protein